MMMKRQLIDTPHTPAAPHTILRPDPRYWRGGIWGFEAVIRADFRHRVRSLERPLSARFDCSAAFFVLPLGADGDDMRGPQSCSTHTLTTHHTLHSSFNRQPPPSHQNDDAHSLAARPPRRRRWYVCRHMHLMRIRTHTPCISRPATAYSRR